MSKQDRQGVRTATDLERKYNFGQVFTDQQKETSRQGDLLMRLNQTLAQFMSFANGAIDTLGTDLDRAEVAISNLEAAISSLEKRVSKNETEIFEHEQAILALEESHARFGTRLDTAEGVISGLETRMGEAEGNITALDQRISALENA